MQWLTGLPSANRHHKKAQLGFWDGFAANPSHICLKIPGDFNLSPVNKSIPITILKPAACLLVGASAVFGCSAANALTFNWSFVNGSDTFSGQLINLSPGLNDSASNAVNPFYATVTTAPSSFANITSRQLDFFSGDLTVSQDGATVSNNSIRFTYISPGVESYDLFVNQASNGIANFVVSYLDRTSIFNPPVDSGGIGPITSGSGAAVPGPLPILGLPAAFLSTRKLRKRIQASRATSSASLD
jgi:hypothetical protein